MSIRAVHVAMALWGTTAFALECAEPSDLALWLERVPGTADVLVVGSWQVDDLQGWSWGVCHDPAAARVEGGEECSYRRPERCPGIRFTEDYLTMWLGGPPNFENTSVWEGGVSHGMVVDFCVPCVLPSSSRFEMVRISYDIIAEPVTLEFCDTLGNPHVAVVMVFCGASIPPAVQQGIVLVARHPFTRGDANADGECDIADGIYLLEVLFGRTAGPPCPAAADANRDGQLDIADPVRILGYLFRDHEPFPAPFPECGEGAWDEDSELPCYEFTPCR